MELNHFDAMADVSNKLQCSVFSATIAPPLLFFHNVKGHL